MDIIIQDDTLSNIKSNEKWICSICSEKNSFLTDKCACCSNQRNKKQYQATTYWVCNYCQFQNKKMHTYCEKCSRQRLKTEKGYETKIANANLNKNNSSIEEISEINNELCKKCYSFTINGVCRQCNLELNPNHMERQNKYNEQKICEDNIPTFRCLKCKCYSRISRRFCLNCHYPRPEYYCPFDLTFGNSEKCLRCHKICERIK